LLVSAGLMAMIAFVFLGPLLDYMSGRRAHRENPVVVETNYGNFTQGELENLKYTRDVVDRFLRDVAARGAANLFQQSSLDPRWFQTIADRHYLFWRQRLMGVHAGPEQGAIETLVLSQRAQQMGMVISDQAINDLIMQITENRVTPDELQTIIRSLNPSRPVSEARLFAALRTEMLAAEYRQLFLRSLQDLPPAQRFEYYARLNRRAKTEIMPLDVSDFVDQVPNPDEAEIKRFYEQYKSDYPNPDSPQPGFKEPKRATFQYFKASVDQLAEKLKGDVTEEEIRKYYDANKDQFREFDLGASGEEKGADKKDDPKPEGEKAGEEKPATDKPTEEKPAAEKPATDEPKTEKPDTKENPTAEKDAAPQASARTRRPPVRLVSTQADSQKSENAKPAETSNADPPKSGSQPDATKPVVSAEKPVDKAEEKPVEQKPATENPTEEKPAADKPGEQKPPEPRYQPLEKVADQIRMSLARQKAEERLREQFDALSAEMRRYQDELDVYSTEKQARPGAKPPVPLDFAKLAEGKDVQAFELKSVSAQQAAESDLGKSFRVVPNQRTQMPFTVPFVNFAFADSLPLYKSEQDRDNDNNIFLFWKTEEEPAFVPPLDQIRAKVVLAWKKTKARDLARKRAAEFAAQARSLKKPLAELFGSQSKLKIFETSPFSWLTLGNIPADPSALPRLSEIENIDRPGTEFMKTVFGLEPAGVGVALNEPQTMVFVIRLINFEPGAEELRDDFARTNPSRYMAAATEDQRVVYQAWLADLNKEAGVHWIRQADARRTLDEEAEF
jgi:hypothetical protein